MLVLTPNMKWALHSCDDVTQQSIGQRDFEHSTMKKESNIIIIFRLHYKPDGNVDTLIHNVISCCLPCLHLPETC